MRILVALALCVPLGGCFSLTGPKPLPEWAMAPQADISESQVKPRHAAARRPVQRTAVRAPEEALAGTPTQMRATGLSSSGQISTVAQSPGTKAFGPEWQAREEELDANLRRRMNICRGC